MRWIGRIRGLFRRDRLAEEMDEELSFHLSMREEWNVRRGMPAAEARRDARVRFGNPSRWRELMSEIDLMTLPQTVLQDLRYGMRMLARNASFTSLAVLALALGIGVNTAAFTAYKAFFALPLDANDPDEMVNLGLLQHSGATTAFFSYPDYQAYRDDLHSFSGVIAVTGYESLTVSGTEGIARQPKSGVGALVGRLNLMPASVSDAEFAGTEVVSENYFEVLGVTALRGRIFKAEDTAALAAFPSVLISENYWEKRFGRDPALLGKTIRLNGAAFSVIGITPHNFVGTAGFTVPDFWLPLSLLPLVHPHSELLRDREDQCCRLFARLAPGSDISHAQAEMNLLTDRLRALHESHSELNKPTTAMVWEGSPFPLPMKQYRGIQFSLLLIMSAVGMVLVIACANVASLQLARTTARQNELSMRLSLGASRFRLVRQLLTESALLGLMAGVVALIFAWGFMSALASLLAATIPAEYGNLVYDMTPDLGVFAYVFAISLVAGVLFGLVPALESSRSALSSALKAHSGSSPRRSRLLRDSLIATQVSIAVTLMIAGSLFIHTSLKTLQADPGYNMDGVVDLNLQFPEGARYTTEHKLSLLNELRRRLASLPGAVSVTSADGPLMGYPKAAVAIHGEKPSAGNSGALMSYELVQSNYFATLSIPLLSGNSFPSQAGRSESSVIVSESAAKELWPGLNPIGRSLRLGTIGQVNPKNKPFDDEMAYQVIGVASDARSATIDGNDTSVIYLPMPEGRLLEHPILIRTQSDPLPVMNGLASVISATDPEVVAHASTLAQLFRTTTAFALPSTAAAVATPVGLIGLLLAMIGIYGTVSYIVVLRTREIGIRMALGAKKQEILALMLRESLRPVMAGLLTGTCIAVGVSYVLRRVLHGIGMVDGVSFAGVSILFLTIAVFAAYVPSRRTLRVDPVVALRCE